MIEPGTILQIALKTPLRRLFDYTLPESISVDSLKIGVRVRVPFGRQTKIGILVSFGKQSSVPVYKLKPISEILDTHPILTDDLISLCQWASDYYHAPLGELFACALPKRLREGHEPNIRQRTIWHLCGDLETALQACQRAAKQQQALRFIAEFPSGVDDSVVKSQQITSATLQTLQQKRFIEPILENPDQSTPLLIHSPHLLNDEQQQAVNEITAGLGEFNRFLLDGVTGSGKTEVYLQAMAACLQQGKSCLVLVPEIGLTPQTIARFQARFQAPMAVLHSGLNDGERLDAWLRAKFNLAKIIIGTRSAIFTPIPNLGMIIIDEEHDGSFKQQDTVRYSARDLALVRGMQKDIPVILGTATPSLETLHNAQSGKFNWLKLPERAGKALKPCFTIIDCRQTILEKTLSKQLMDAMQQHLQAGNQVLLFINRRGYAPILMCHSCGWVAKCHHCDANLTIHNSPRLLQCHHCGKSHSVHKNCLNCQSNQLFSLGTGTEKLAEMLTEQFATVPIVRIDRDSTRRKGSMDHLLDTVNTGAPMILVGTQMLAKGHHFANVTLVGILDADAGFFSPDFRSVERMGQLITQVAGRAGRAEKAGEVIIQTRQPENPFLQCLIQQGYAAFSNALLSDRKIATLPPFAHIALIRAENIDKSLANAWLSEVKNQLQQNKNKLQVYGPIPAMMEKRKGVFRAHLLLHSVSRQDLQDSLQAAIPFLENKTKPHNLRWSLDVDPIEVLS